MTCSRQCSDWTLVACITSDEQSEIKSSFCGWRQVSTLGDSGMFTYCNLQKKSKSRMELFENKTGGVDRCKGSRQEQGLSGAEDDPNSANRKEFLA